MFKRICKYCGKEFETTSSVKKFCDGPHYNTCEYCGNQFEIKDIHYISRTCSRECEGKLRRDNAQKTSLEKYGVKNAGYIKESQEKIKKTNQKRYGVDYAFQAESVKNHIRQANIEKYGVDNPMKSKEIQEKAAKTNIERYGDSSVLGRNSSIRLEIDKKNIERFGNVNLGGTPESIEKIKKTNLKRYGAEWAAQTEEFQQKRIGTCIEKYGGPSPMNSSEVVEQFRANMLEKYGVEWPSQRDDVKDKVSRSCTEKYGVAWPCLRPEYRKNVHKISSINLAFAKELNESKIQYEMEFPLEHKAYDFKINNLLIELNPTFTHTSYEYICSVFGPVPKDYHKIKSEIAKRNGYRCIHIFDWDEKDKVIFQLKSKSNIFARKCEIRLVNKYECDEFLNNYHLQNSCRGQEVRIGLYSNNKLLEIMTFGKPRYNKKYEWELLRLCTKPSINVVGGASKLFKHFIKTYNPESVISYCNLSKFNGDVYEKIGMKHIYDVEPNKIWSKGTEMITNNLLMQRGYDQLFDANYGKGTSNEDLMLSHGWLPVYDCGQGVYEYKRGD